MKTSRTLREIRESKGVMLKAVAKHVGLTRQAYAKHEAKPWKMSIAEANSVCDFLGIIPDEVSDFSAPER